MLTQTAAIVDSSTLINLAATDLLGEIVGYISPTCHICRSIVENDRRCSFKIVVYTGVIPKGEL